MDQINKPSETLPAQPIIDGVAINADVTEGAFLVDGCDTIPKLLKARADELGERTAMREKDYGIWLSYSWNDTYKHSKLIGLGLLSLGLKKFSASLAN